MTGMHWLKLAYIISVLTLMTMIVSTCTGGSLHF